SYAPLPKGEGLCVWVVHAKGSNSLFHPKEEKVTGCFPQAAGMLSPEIEGINVFVLLGGVLSVANAPIRTDEEPLRMFLHPGMIRCALQGEVQSDFDPELATHLHQVSKVLKSAKLGMDGIMSTCLGANRPRAPYVTRLGHRRIVPTLSIHLTDGVNRGKIDDVKTHRRDLGDASLGVFECTM